MIIRSLLLFAAIAPLLGAAPRGETVFWDITPVVADGTVSHLDLTLHFQGSADGETVITLPDHGGANANSIAGSATSGPNGRSW